MFTFGNETPIVALSNLLGELVKWLCNAAGPLDVPLTKHQFPMLSKH